MSTQNQYESPSQQWSPETEKTAAALAQAAPIFVEFLGPILAYLLLRDKGPFIRHHVTESLNFSISVLIYSIPVYAILAISIVGWALFWLPPVVVVAFRVYAAMLASRGQFYKYPLILRFVG